MQDQQAQHAVTCHILSLTWVKPLKTCHDFFAPKKKEIKFLIQACHRPVQFPQIIPDPRVSESIKQGNIVYIFLLDKKNIIISSKAGFLFTDFIYLFYTVLKWLFVHKLHLQFCKYFISCIILRAISQLKKGAY